MDEVTAYRAPEPSALTHEELLQKAYDDGWKQGVIAMETWTLEQGLNRRDVHSVAVQIMHNPMSQQDRQEARFAGILPKPQPPLDVTKDLADKRDNGDDRDIFGQAIEDKLADDQHEEYVKESTNE